MDKVKLSQNIARIGLGAFLAFAGTSHLTFARKDFQAQVPDWVPLNKDLVVLLSGGVEVSLGLALMLMKKQRKCTGLLTAAFLQQYSPAIYPNASTTGMPSG
ncbi:MAG: hypothetical protein LUH15_18035 [Tannerellaceae bacterium]|nr:hypothetical protein [Tannerellaceae bacterium]